MVAEGHSYDPNCACCTEGMQAVEDKEQEGMSKDGWYAHVVVDDPSSSTGFNYHTHGFRETLKHPDIQIVFPVDPSILHNLVWHIFKTIENGAKYKHGDKVSGIVKDYQIKFIDTIECGRHVLCLILPDQHGNLDQLTIQPPFDAQY